jgi:hypothetical protein
MAKGGGKGGTVVGRSSGPDAANGASNSSTSDSIEDAGIVITLPHAGHFAFFPAFSDIVENFLPHSHETLICMARPRQHGRELKNGLSFVLFVG